MTAENTCAERAQIPRSDPPADDLRAATGIIHGALIGLALWALLITVALAEPMDMSAAALLQPDEERRLDQHRVLLCYEGEPLRVNVSALKSNADAINAAAPTSSGGPVVSVTTLMYGVVEPVTAADQAECGDNAGVCHGN